MSEHDSIDLLRLMDYLDGHLDAAEAESVRAELAANPSLRHELEVLEALNHDIAALNPSAGAASIQLDVTDTDAFIALACGHLDGDLSADDNEAFEQLLASSDAFRREFRAMELLYGDLGSLGDAVKAGSPSVDLVASVMDTIAPAPRTHSVVPFPGSRNHRPAFWLGGAGAAAAALIAAVAWMLWMAGSPGPIEISDPGAPQVATVPEPVDEPWEDVTAPDQASDAAKLLLAEILTTIDRMDRPEREDHTQDTSVYADLSPVGVFQLRRDAAVDPSAREELVRLSRLPADLARMLANSEHLTAKGRIAAAAMLEVPDASEMFRILDDAGVLGDDRIAHLQRAIAALAERGMGDADAVDNPSLSLEDALESIFALQEQDPDNALAWYLEAAARFYGGDTEGALEALSEAGTRERAHAYAGEAALYDTEALIAAGMSPDAARSVAGLNAGVDEYRLLMDLGVDLLTLGRDFVETDPATAQAIFGSVDQFGQQLQTEPQYSYEYLAGMDLQRQALWVFEEFWNVLGLDQATMATLTGDAEVLTSAYSEFQVLLNAINEVFFGEVTTELMNGILNVLFWDGDMYLPPFLTRN